MTQKNRGASQRRSRRSRTKEGSTSSKRQVNYHDLYNPFPPMEVFSTDQVASMHNTSLKISEDLGMKVLLPEAIKIYRMAGANAGPDEIGFDNALSHVDPSGHFFACPQTMERYSTEFYEPIVHDYANFGTWSEGGARDASTRATDVWQGIVNANSSIKVDDEKLDALQSFIAKRTAEDGAPPES